MVSYCKKACAKSIWHSTFPGGAIPCVLAWPAGSEQGGVWADARQCRPDRRHGRLALGFWSNKNGQAIFNAGTGSLTINGTTYANITDLQVTDVLNLVRPTQDRAQRSTMGPGAGSTTDNTVGGGAVRHYENALQTLLGAINNNQVLVVVQ